MRWRPFLMLRATVAIANWIDSNDAQAMEEEMAKEYNASQMKAVSGGLSGQEVVLIQVQLHLEYADQSHKP